MADRIDLYLGQVYHARNKGNPAPSETAFRSLINADHSFRKEAEARLASLTPAILKRDHVSRIHHEVLTRMLHAD